MKISLLLALCAPALVAAQNLPAPPTVSKATIRPMTAPLPPQVGKVSAVLNGDYVPGVASGIVLGDKRPSLCYQAPAGKSRSVAYCQPILSKSYKEIRIRRVGTNLLFMAAPNSKAGPETFKIAASSFMGGLERAQKSLARHAAAPRTAPAQGVADTGGGGGSCGYGDGDSAPTCGTDGGSGSGSADGGGDYPGSGGDWGGGSLDWATSTGCVATPYGWLCTGKRSEPQIDPWGSPVVGNPQEVNWNAAWFPQSWCNAIHILCSSGQTPTDNDRGDDSSTSGKTMAELYDICDAIADVEADVCTANSAGMDSRSKAACYAKVNTRRTACYTTARRMTDNGAHVAP